MRSYLVAAAVVAVISVPATAGAAHFVVGQDYASAGTQQTAGNLYIAGGTVTVGAQTGGDLTAAAGTLSVTGPVHGDVLAAGGTVQLLGPVDGDVRGIGGQITVNQRVSGDIVVAAGTLHLLPSAWVDGDVYVAGGQVIIDGNIRGSLVATAGSAIINGTVNGEVRGRYGKLEIGPEAQVGGDVVYRSPSEARIDASAHVTGKMLYTAINQFRAPGISWGGAMWAAVVGLLSLRLLMFLGAAAFLVWRYRRSMIDLFQETVDQWWPSVGRGLAYMILIPIATILLAISIIGTLPAIVLGMAYAAFWIATKVMAGIFLGSLVVMAVKKTRVVRINWWSSLGGVVLLMVVSLIPILGWIVSVLLALAVFGVIARRAHHSVW
ncbi:MAG TPA: polymer-forming cytoskeletal protein [Candidatus Paceibacterota bacterium]|nr:polymer-forming cytoskeletal protein [Candidatus Paceibacterota bacterium]